MMPWDKVFEAILGQGGPWPALFLLACGVIMYTYVQHRGREGEHRVENNKWDDERADIYEKRLEETKQLLTALERNTSALAALTASVEGRTIAVNELVQGFAALVRTQDMSREHFKGQADRIERIAEANRQSLEDVKRVVSIYRGS